MVQLLRTAASIVLGIAVLSQAHPGHDIQAEAAERAAALKGKRGLSGCADNLKARGFEAKNIARRELAVNKLRHKLAAKSMHSVLYLAFILVLTISYFRTSAAGDS